MMKSFKLGWGEALLLLIATIAVIALIATIFSSITTPGPEELLENSKIEVRNLNTRLAIMEETIKRQEEIIERQDQLVEVLYDICMYHGLLQEVE